tara:strand:- start:21387 stop:22328 length:942 start_codon:yes stop_codon:yes gene_type:complete
METIMNDTPLKNRILKKYKTLKKWAKTEQTEAYRLINRDIPEYPFTIDLYGPCAVVHIGAVEGVDSPEKIKSQLEEIRLALSEIGIQEKDLYIKERQRQRGDSQYQRLDRATKLMEVKEGKALLQVNLSDFLDTGLFLDHRPLRKRMFQESAGKKVLNLFCYTGSVTVQAALGGAKSSLSVDMSNTYLDWAQRNFLLNGISTAKHALLRADALDYLVSEKEKFDIIFLDPPSFSNSKKMQDAFDIQRDHPGLIAAAIDRLTTGGTLYFSTNKKKFKFDEELLEASDAKEITYLSVPKDFAGPLPHKAWIIKKS